MTVPSDIEHLLAHADWLTSLARQLVADAATADDLVQETWIAALRRPPAPDRPARPWLSTVIRRLAALRSRREGTRAEHRGPGLDPTPATDEAAMRVEQERVLAGLVLALEQPYRGAILLRFYRGMTAVQAARELGLPPATVRTHLKRGLERLRVRLDEANGGDGRSWMTALAPLCSTALAPKTIASMGTAAIMTKSFAGVALAAIAAFWWWPREDSPTPAPAATASNSPTIVEAVRDMPPAIRRPAEVSSARVERAQNETGSTSTPAEETGLIVRALRRDDGMPIQGVHGHVKPASPAGGHSIGWPEGERRARLLENTRSDASGILRFDLPHGKRLVLSLSSRARNVGSLELPLAPLEQGELRTVVAQVPVGPDLHYVGRIVDDATDAPLRDVEVVVPEGQSTGGVVEQYTATTTDTDGYFVINGLSWERQHLEVDTPGYGLLLAVLVAGHDTRDTAQELRLLRAATLDVRVSARGGVPVAVEVRATTDFAGLIRPRTDVGDTTGWSPVWSKVTGSDGQAEMPGLPPGVPIALELWRGGELLRRVAQAPRLGSGETRVLELSLGDGANLWGETRGSNGAPVAGMSVVLRAADREKRDRYLNRWDNEKAEQQVTTDQDGRFVFKSVPPGNWLVGPACLREPEGPFDASHPPPLAILVRIGENTTEEYVQLEVAPGLSIRGRVVDAAGAPGAKLWVQLGSERLDGAQNFLTGVDGRFTAGPLAPGRFRLIALGRGQSANSAPMWIEAGATDEILLTLEPAAEIRGRVVDSESGEGRAAELRLISANDPSGYVRWEDSSREGHFDLESLDLGTYHLLARSDDGGIALLRDLRISRSTSLEGVEVRLRPGAILIVSAPEATQDRGFSLRHDGLHAGHGFAGPAKISEQVLLPGRTTVLYQGLGGNWDELEVDLVSGERRELALPLRVGDDR